MSGRDLLLLVVGVLASTPAFCWDEHRTITRDSLLGLRTAEPALWQKLDAKVTVTPIDEFFSKAFGPECNYQKARETVLEGIGRDFQVYYTDGVDFHLDVTWDIGLSRQTITPRTQGRPDNPQALGREVKALDVLTDYSDEPDWGMDDDVARLKGRGLSGDAQGTATRVLRHFWYEGEESFGVDFGKDQETDRRAQLYYELSLIAFKVNEPYWGYRFLADALHYVQDVTQPFHVKAMISDSMIDKLELFRAAMCDWRKSPSCKPEDTLAYQVIQNSWVVGAYHGAYEDFVRGLLSKYAPFSSYDMLMNTYYDREVEPLNWTSASMTPLIDFRSVIRAEQQVINQKFSDNVGDYVYNAFGWHIHYEKEACMKQVMDTGSDHSEPYLIATLWRMGPDVGPTMTARQEKYVPMLVDVTHEVLKRTGSWTRQLVRQTLGSLDNADVEAALAKQQSAFQKKCTAPTSL